MTPSALSFIATFDGSAASASLVWPGADQTHIALFDTTPAEGFPAITPSLTSHTSTGATLSVPPGWQGSVLLTLLQGAGPQWGLPIITSGRATFAASSSAALVWDKPMPDAGYVVMPGPPVVSDAAGAVVLAVDIDTKQRTGLTIRSSGVFTGYADVLAFQPGANPTLGLG